MDNEHVAEPFRSALAGMSLAMRDAPTIAENYARIRADVEAENAARNAALKSICDAYDDETVIPTKLLLAICHARGLLNG